MEVKEKRAAENEMVGWHHQLSGHEFAQTREIVKDREAWCALRSICRLNRVGLRVHTSLEGGAGESGISATEVSPNGNQTECDTLPWEKGRSWLSTLFLPSLSPITHSTLNMVLQEEGGSKALVHRED